MTDAPRAQFLADRTLFIAAYQNVRVAEGLAHEAMLDRAAGRNAIAEKSSDHYSFVLKLLAQLSVKAS